MSINTRPYNPVFRQALLVLVVGLIALVPRVYGLNDFYTIDEGYHWPGRVERFSIALITRDWAATDQTGHPGVTTMWLGALGRWLAFQRGIADPGWAGGGADYLAMLRLPLAITNALIVVIGMLLLQRLIGQREALLSGIFWATSPFLIAHSRLLHLDALLTSFIALSILLLLVALQHSRNWLALIGSAICAGLALLTKAPSLILLPFVGLVMFGYCWVGLQNQLNTTTATYSQPSVSRSNLFLGSLRQSIPLYIAWLLCAVAVVFALWPAMWVNPFGAVGSVIHEIIDNGGQPHHSGNYFLGQPVADPGIWFYPAVLILRTTPLTLLGLLGLIFWLATNRRLFTQSRHTQPPKQHQEAAVIFTLLTFSVLFGLLMSLQAKKLDRYLLPIWPMLEILAAIGWVRCLALLGAWLHKRFGSLEVPYFAFAEVFMLICATTLWFAHPYYLAYYNPLVGGGPTAERVMLVGTGEGMEQVGTWLRSRPDLGHGDLLSWIPPTLAPFVPQEILVRDLRPEYLSQPSSYAVLYIRSVQHGESREAEAVVRQTPALYTLTINGIPYATIHQIARPFTTPIDAIFAQDIHLRGISSTHKTGMLMITPSWDIRADRSAGMVAFVHVLDANGTKVGQVDAALDQGMFGWWQAGQQFDAALPVALPELPPGEYRVVMGVYDPKGGRLPLTQGNPLPDSVDGPNTIEVLRFSVAAE